MEIDGSECLKPIETNESVRVSTDSNEIRLTQLSYSLMRILSNDNYTETVKSFLQRKCAKIALHSFAVSHPLSHGNAYHSRVILECLLQNCPKELFECIAKNKGLKQLLKCALFRNINRGNMNSVSRQKLYKQQTQINQPKLMKLLCEWAIIPYIIKPCPLYPQIFCQFFIDLTRSAALQGCKPLFSDAYAVLIVNELIGKGLLGNDAQSVSVWTQIQCTQTLIQFLDICSRPTIFDSNNNGKDSTNANAYPNKDDTPNTECLNPIKITNGIIGLGVIEDI